MHKHPSEIKRGDTFRYKGQTFIADTNALEVLEVKTERVYYSVYARNVGKGGYTSPHMRSISFRKDHKVNIV